MPQYAAPIEAFGSRAGGALGATTGATSGGFLGRLGEVLSPLDWPRRAAANLFAAPSRAMDTGDASHLWGAVPGAAGAVLGGVMGGPLGILVGSLLAGGLQGMGQATGSEVFDAPNVSDLTGTEDFAPNLLVGMLTDPLTFAGGIGGAAAGAKTGGKIGRGIGESLEAAANFRGPAYPGGFEKIVEAVRAANPSLTDDAIRQTYGHLDNPRLLGEMPPQSSFLGEGVERTAFLRPETEGGGVLTFAKSDPNFINTHHGGFGKSAYEAGQPPPTRIDTPLMNPAVRSVPVGPIRAEVSPQLKTADQVYEDITGFSMDTAPTSPTMNSADFQAMEHLAKARVDIMDALDQQGLRPADLHYGNIGLGQEGWKILDPGSVHPWGKSGFAPRVPEMEMEEPGFISNLLLRLLGSDKAVRREIMEQLARHGEAPPVRLPGVTPLPDMMTPRAEPVTPFSSSAMTPLARM